jgi:acetolactate synthase-1/3 small subunit
MSGNIIDSIVRNHHARILVVSPEYTVIEKTGHKTEINDLLNHLEPYGLLQFACSGRVAVTKQVKELNAYLSEMDGADRYRNENIELFEKN